METVIVTIIIIVCFVGVLAATYFAGYCVGHEEATKFLKASSNWTE